MAGGPLTRILLIGESAAPEARTALESCGFGVTQTAFSGIDPAELSRSHGLILVVDRGSVVIAQSLCRRWRIEFGEQFVPILAIAEADVAAQALLDSGVDVVVRQPVALDHLVAQARALLRIQHVQGRLAGRAAEASNLNRKLQQIYQQIESDTELTRKLHRGFLPKAFPEVERVRFAVCHRPRSRIGGDFFDVLRLDENHVSFYVADAMGRGLPGSSLLSIFVRKSLRTKEITGRNYRLIGPNESLEFLNRDLVGLNLAEPPFVTMGLMQINCRDGKLSYARAAHPHPLIVPRDGSPAYWNAPGTLLGVFESQYPVQERTVQTGDKVVLFSDGVHPADSGPGLSDDPLLEIVRKYRRLAVQPFIDSVARDLLESSRHADDFTLLGMEFGSAVDSADAPTT